MLCLLLEKKTDFGPLLRLTWRCLMNETVEEKIDRFYKHFERRATSVGSLGETRESDLFARILFTSMLDTLSKVSADDPEDRIASGTRFVAFIKRHSAWDAATRVSLLHLARALEGQPASAFSKLCSWVAEGLSTALPAIPNPEFVVQHPGVVERPITVDPTLEETEKHWPKENGRPIRLEVGSISGRGGLRPCHFTHAELLWRYRCYLIHEFRVPGEGWDVKKTGEPYYQNMAEAEWEVSNPSDSVWKVTSRHWELVYTLGFLRELCRTSLCNLRQQLISESKNPYQAFKFGSYWLSVLN
jgi:hypothetical protein